MGILKLVAKGLKFVAIISLEITGWLCTIKEEKAVPSCGFYGITVGDGIIIVLVIEDTSSVELAETVPALVLLAGCSPLLLFMGLTIFLTYILTRFLFSLLVILPLPNLMHSHNIRSLLNIELKNKKLQKTKDINSHKNGPIGRANLFTMKLSKQKQVSIYLRD